MHKTLIIVFALAIVGGCSGAWAKDSPGQVQCKAGRSECENKCPKVESDASRECYQVCSDNYKRCSKLDGRIDIRGTQYCRATSQINLARRMRQVGRSQFRAGQLRQRRASRPLVRKLPILLLPRPPQLALYF